MSAVTCKTCALFVVRAKDSHFGWCMHADKRVGQMDDNPRGHAPSTTSTKTCAEHQERKE